jgi:hypothetical protein
MLVREQRRKTTYRRYRIGPTVALGLCSALSPHPVVNPRGVVAMGVLFGGAARPWSDRRARKRNLLLFDIRD